MYIYQWNRAIWPLSEMVSKISRQPLKILSWNFHTVFIQPTLTFSNVIYADLIVWQRIKCSLNSISEQNSFPWQHKTGNWQKSIIYIFGTNNINRLAVLLRTIWYQNHPNRPDRSWDIYEHTPAQNVYLSMKYSNLAFFGDGIENISATTEDIKLKLSQCLY